MNHQATRCGGENKTSSPETSGSQPAIDRLELYATEAIGNEFAAVDLPKLKVRENHHRRNELALSSWHGQAGGENGNLRGRNFGSTRDYEVKAADTVESTSMAVTGVVVAVAATIGVCLVCLFH